MGDGVPPEGGLGGVGGGFSPVVMYLHSPIPISFKDPQQLQSYPCLDMHFPSSRRVLAWGVYLGNARRGSVSRRGDHSLSLRRGSHCLLLCRALMPFPGDTKHRQPEPCPLAPEVARVICEVLAPSPPRGVPESRGSLSDFHFPINGKCILLLLFCAACVSSCISKIIILFCC